jgi:hypothetical protein
VEDAEEFEEEVEEGLDHLPPEDLAEYLALEHDEHIIPMNFVGLDITDKKTSIGKEGDAVSTQPVYKHINSKYSLFLVELEDFFRYLPSWDSQLCQLYARLPVYSVVHFAYLTHCQSYQRISYVSSTQAFRPYERRRQNSLERHDSGKQLDKRFYQGHVG